MKKHIFFTTMLALLLTACYTPVFAQLAKVNSYSGVRVYIESTPVGQYETLGEVVLSLPPDIHTYTTVDGKIRQYVSSPHYAKIRDGLITQSVMANRATNGIIISGERATMLRIDEDDPNANYATVNRDGDLYLFIECTPATDYDFVGKVETRGVVSDYFMGVISKIRYRATKDRKLKKQRYNAAIFHIDNTAGSYADYVLLK